jgi:predicted DNA binding CopG/RHH family protein
MSEEKFLDTEEKVLMESLEKDDGWKTVANLEEWKTRLSKAAANTLTKDQRMNIRITKKDLQGIKLRAIEEGIPYQTLVASIIHKYLSGTLIERKIS